MMFGKYRLKKAIRNRNLPLLIKLLSSGLSPNTVLSWTYYPVLRGEPRKFTEPMLNTLIFNAYIDKSPLWMDGIRVLLQAGASPSMHGGIHDATPLWLLTRFEDMDSVNHPVFELALLLRSHGAQASEKGFGYDKKKVLEFYQLMGDMAICSPSQFRGCFSAYDSAVHGRINCQREEWWKEIFQRPVEKQYARGLGFGEMRLSEETVEAKGLGMDFKQGLTV